MTKNDIVDFIGENRKKIWYGIILGSFIFVACATTCFIKKVKEN